MALPANGLPAWSMVVQGGLEAAGVVEGARASWEILYRSTHIACSGPVRLELQAHGTRPTDPRDLMF